MKVGSLFSGIGGFDLAFERAGFEIAWQCEIDKHASAVLARRWPGVRNYGDVKEVTHGAPPIDVLVGGFPCQDVSVAGRRAGLAGERSGLWFEFHRIARELRPRFVVIENVPGLLASNGRRDFGVIVRGLVACGYRVAWRVLDAQYFGLAQRRKRVFIVASLGDGRAAEILFEREGVRGDPPSRGETGEGVAGTLGGSSQSGGFRTTDLDNSGVFVMQERAVSENVKAGPQGKGWQRDQAYTLEARHHAQIVATLSPENTAEHAYRGDGGDPLVFEARYARNGRGAPSDVAYIPPIVPNAISAKWAKGAGGPAGDEIQNLVAPLQEWMPGAHPGGLNGQEAENQTLVQHGAVRRLTPTECERLQGFPDGWTAGQADSHRYRQLGNAVAVPVVEWIARRIMEVAK